MILLQSMVSSTLSSIKGKQWEKNNIDLFGASSTSVKIYIVRKMTIKTLLF